MGREIFSYPKPSKLIEKLIDNTQIKEGYILDFFCGSGTTAESIIKMNLSEGIRKFIMIQLPESLDENIVRIKDKKEKTIIENQITLCDECGYPHTLDYIGIERIKRVVKQIKEEKKQNIKDKTL